MRSAAREIRLRSAARPALARLARQAVRARSACAVPRGRAVVRRGRAAIDAGPTGRSAVWKSLRAEISAAAGRARGRIADTARWRPRDHRLVAALPRDTVRVRSTGARPRRRTGVPERAAIDTRRAVETAGRRAHHRARVVRRTAAGAARRRTHAASADALLSREARGGARAADALAGRIASIGRQIARRAHRAGRAARRHRPRSRAARPRAATARTARRVAHADAPDTLLSRRARGPGLTAHAAARARARVCRHRVAREARRAVAATRCEYTRVLARRPIAATARTARRVAGTRPRIAALAGAARASAAAAAAACNARICAGGVTGDAGAGVGSAVHQRRSHAAQPRAAPRRTRERVAAFAGTSVAVLAVRACPAGQPTGATRQIRQTRVAGVAVAAPAARAGSAMADISHTRLADRADRVAGTPLSARAGLGVEAASIARARGAAIAAVLRAAAGIAPENAEISDRVAVRPVLAALLAVAKRRPATRADKRDHAQRENAF